VGAWQQRKGAAWFWGGLCLNRNMYCNENKIENEKLTNAVTNYYS